MVHCPLLRGLPQLPRLRDRHTRALCWTTVACPLPLSPARACSRPQSAPPQAGQSAWDTLVLYGDISAQAAQCCMRPIAHATKTAVQWQAPETLGGMGRTAAVDAEALAAALMCSGTARSAGSGITPELIFSATCASWRARSSRCFWMAASSCWLLFSFSLASWASIWAHDPQRQS